MPQTAGAASRRSKKERSRQVIAAAALSLFESQGYEATTMDAIAETAGVSRPTVFNHFPRKEDILLVVGELLRERVAARIRGLPVTGLLADPIGALREVLVTMAGAFSEYPRTAGVFHRFKLQGVGAPPGDGEAAVPVQEERDLIVLLVEAAQARGELRADYRADEITDHLMIGLFAATVGPWLEGRHAGTSLEHLVDRHVELYLGGLRARPDLPS